MKTWLVAIGAALLVGCANQSVVKVDGLERSDAVPAQDLRPEIEKQGERYSISVSNPAYGLYRLPDTDMTPTATRLLRHRAFEKFGPTEAVKIHHLVVYRNAQAELRQFAISTGMATAGYVTAIKPAVVDTLGIGSAQINGASFETSASQDYQRASYSSAENPTRASVNIVFIETEIKGQRVFTRTLAPMKIKGVDDTLAAAVEAAIKFNLAQYR
jgi:hypothetical protein